MTNAVKDSIGTLDRDVEVREALVIVGKVKCVLERAKNYVI